MSGLPTGHVVTADEFNASVGANSVEFRTNSLSLSTTSSTLVDMPGASTSFTKLLGSTASNLVVLVSCSMFSTVGSTTLDIAINCNSTDTTAGNFVLNTANVHETLPTGSVSLTGLAAGTYTVKVRTKRNSGTGALTQDGTDSVLMQIWEKLT